MKISAIWFLCLLLLAGCRVSFSPNASSNLPDSTAGTIEQQREAESAAKNYLALIDSKQYDKTWAASGPALRTTSTKIAWVNGLALTRKTFNVSSKREIEGFGFSTRIDTAVPVGEYVLVQFKNVSGNVTTTEKVVMQKDQSAWKIIGYFVDKRAEYKTGT